jgi:2-hydroxychromene-2-carboxylate isomerase
MSVRDRLQRRVLPRLVVALSTVRWPGRVAAALRRARGGHARVELFVAFDDPQSAVALLGVDERLAGRRANLVVRPVVARGIPGDPAVDAKRAYAIVDARRLARRAGRELTRTAPLAAADVAFIAEWAAAAPSDATRTAFSIAAMRELWLASDGPVEREAYAALWREHAGGEPPAYGDAAAAERAYRRRKLYDTPVAVVHGQWFFAHERLPAIEHRLDELGWKVAA